MIDRNAIESLRVCRAVSRARTNRGGVSLRSEVPLEIEVTAVARVPAAIPSSTNQLPPPLENRAALDVGLPIKRLQWFM